MNRPRLRAARPEDVPAMVELKRSLPLVVGAEARRGGFLLGCSAERYDMLVRHACVTLLETGGRLAGFAVALPDAALRSSELWERRQAIAWSSGEAEPAQEEPIAYFDQLALAPWASRIHAGPLALAAVRDLAAAGHVHLYATTLAEPVCNGASLPLLRAFGARTVGTLCEDYPDVGRTVSRLHHAAIAAGLARVAARSAGVRAAETAARLAA